MLDATGNGFWNVNIFECLISPTVRQHILAATVLNDESQNGGVLRVINVDFMFDASVSD